MTPSAQDLAPRHGCLYRVIRAVAVCVGLVAVATVSGYVAMLWFLEADKMAVPRVIGLDSVAAEALVTEVGLTSRVIADEFSTAVPKGHVTRQRPPHGTRLKLGGEVRLIVSRGSDQLAAPDLSGLTPAQAGRVLAEAGLVSGPVTAIHSDAHRRETIIAQDPPAGATVTRGAAIRLLESLGPWEDIVVVPDLRGREMVVALNLLKELQLEARLSFNESIAQGGTVIDQDPAPGAQVKVGAQVQLTIGD
jgi:eukaryotic-like serine/threonine-protein kinase